MSPLSVDLITCKEALGDSLVRSIEAKARADADKDKFEAPLPAEGTYWTGVLSSMASIVYLNQFQKRRSRNYRKSLKFVEARPPI